MIKTAIFCLILTQTSRKNAIPDDENTFVVNNMSDKCITFPFDWGIKVFAKQDTGWIESKNGVTYYRIKT